jgi:hypothetical protein
LNYHHHYHPLSVVFLCCPFLLWATQLLTQQVNEKINLLLLLSSLLSSFVVVFLCCPFPVMGNLAVESAG